MIRVCRDEIQSKLNLQHLKQSQILPVDIIDMIT